MCDMTVINITSVEAVDCYKPVNFRRTRYGMEEDEEDASCLCQSVKGAENDTLLARAPKRKIALHWISYSHIGSSCALATVICKSIVCIRSLGLSMGVAKEHCWKHTRCHR